MSDEVSGIAGRIKEIRSERDTLDEEESTLWKRFFEIADDTAGEQESFKRIIPEIEHTIAREMHQATPRLNVDALYQNLSPDEWKSITKQQRVFDLTKLEEQMGKGNISPDLIARHTEEKPPVAHKMFKPATAKELKDENSR